MNTIRASTSGIERLAVAAYSEKEGMCRPNTVISCSVLVGSGM